MIVFKYQTIITDATLNKLELYNFYLCIKHSIAAENHYTHLRPVYNKALSIIF